MYKKPKFKSSSISRNESTEGETMEMKVERILNNKEPIKDNAPLIYTERKEGVKPSYNIRSDRWEIAIDAMDKVEKSYKARREETGNKPKKENGETEPIQGKTPQGSTDGNPNPTN